MKWLTRLFASEPAKPDEPLPEECCGTCWFWRSGECRVLPPEYKRHVDNFHGVAWDSRRFPSTGKRDWCGKWESQTRVTMQSGVGSPAGATGMLVTVRHRPEPS